MATAIQPTTETVVQIPISKITPAPDNVRSDVGDVTDLAESIKAQGILQPLILVEPKPGHYQVVIGHRRLAGAIKAKVPWVPAIVRQYSEDRQRVEAMLVENLQRSDISPLDEARGFRRLVDECQLSTRQVAERVGRSQSHVVKRIALTKLVPEASTALDSGGIDLAAAAELGHVEPELQRKVLDCYRQSRWGGIDGAVKHVKAAQAKVERNKATQERIKREGLDGLVIKASVLDGWNSAHQRVGKPSGYSYRPWVDMTLTEHKKLPCHRWFVDADGNLAGACADPISHKPKAEQERLRKEAAKSKELTAQHAADRKEADRRAAEAEALARMEFLEHVCHKPPPHATQFLMWALIDQCDDVAPEIIGRILHEPSLKRKELVRAFAGRSQANLERVALAVASLQIEEYAGYGGDESFDRYTEFLRTAGYEPPTLPADRPLPEAAAEEDDDVYRCRVCGCTTDNACEGGCFWVADPEDKGDLCSECLPEIEEKLEAAGAVAEG